jgi:hypothetical protein
LPPPRRGHRHRHRHAANTASPAPGIAGKVVPAPGQFEARLRCWLCRDRRHNGVLIASEGIILDLERLTEPEVDALDHFAETAAMP